MKYDRQLARLVPAILLLVLLSLCMGPAISAAQFANDPAQTIGVNPSLLRQVKLDQKLGETIPLSLSFRDEHGQPVTLRQLFGHGPVILSLVYYQCPMLCTEVLNGLVRTLRQLPLEIGKDFTVVTISIDPAERSALANAKHAMYAGMYGRPGADTGWHFLTGDEPQIHSLADAVGFHYAYDPASHQFAHPSGIFLLTQDGKLSKYFYGIEYPPRDMRLALVETSQNKIGSPVDQILLYCYHFDPHTGKYGLVISRIVKLGAGVTLIGLALLITILFRKENYGIPAATHK